MAHRLELASRRLPEPSGRLVASTVKNNGSNVFDCYQGGKIYVDKIAGEITPAPTTAQLGCLHIGGP